MVVDPMADLVTALQSAITSTTMFANLTSLIPWIGTIVIFAFSYRLVRRSIGGASKGKAKI